MQEILHTQDYFFCILLLGREIFSLGLSLNALYFLFVNSFGSYLLGHDEHSKIPMSAGQMLLAGFNGLFTKLESEVDTLLAAVQHVDPTFEDGVDVYKEIQELQVCIDIQQLAWFVSEILAKD